MVDGNSRPINKEPRARNFAARYVILNATLLLFVSIVCAQEPNGMLTLDDALAYAREHSPRLSAMKQGVATQQAAISAAMAERLPRLTLGAAARESSQRTETAMGFPLTQLAAIPENQPYSRGHLNADVRATIPVFTGGRIRSDVSLAQAQHSFAQVSMRDVERSLDFDVTSTYANLVQLDRDIEASQESVDALTESRRVVAQQLDEGKVARVNLLKVDTRLADVKDTAIEFRNARDIQAGELNALLGRPIETPVIIDMTLPPVSEQPSLDHVSQLARTGNIKYQLAEAQVGVAESSVAQAKSAQWPTLSLAGDVFGQSVDPYSASMRGAVGGAVLSYPFFDWTLSRQVKEAKSRELERREDLKQAELDAGQRILAAYLQVRNSEERIRATETATDYARESLRIEQENQRYGRSIIESLLDAQAALLTSEAKHYRAIADYMTATAAVRRETGH